MNVLRNPVRKKPSFQLGVLSVTGPREKKQKNTVPKPDCRDRKAIEFLKTGWDKVAALTRDLNCTTHGREKCFAFEEHDINKKCASRYKINSSSFVRRKASIVSSFLSFATWSIEKLLLSSFRKSNTRVKSLKEKTFKKPKIKSGEMPCSRVKFPAFFFLARDEGRPGRGFKLSGHV